MTLAQPRAFADAPLSALDPRLLIENVAYSVHFIRVLKAGCPMASSADFRTEAAARVFYDSACGLLGVTEVQLMRGEQTVLNFSRTIKTRNRGRKTLTLRSL